MSPGTYARVTLDALTSAKSYDLLAMDFAGSQQSQMMTSPLKTVTVPQTANPTLFAITTNPKKPSLAGIVPLEADLADASETAHAHTEREHPTAKPDIEFGRNHDTKSRTDSKGMGQELGPCATLKSCFCPYRTKTTVPLKRRYTTPP
jgi:hypothetical protein